MKPKLPSFIRVDKNRLDEEWEELPPTYMKYALKVADAQHTIAELEAEYDLVQADLDNAIRKKPSRYGFTGEPKEAGIKSCIIRQQEYKDALAALNAAKNELRVFQAAVKSLEIKKTALENESWLDQRGYFMRPGLPKRAKSS